MSNALKFLSFDEVLAAHENDPDAIFVGLNLLYYGVELYLVGWPDDGEGIAVDVAYGQFFEDEVHDGLYDRGHVPPVVRQLFFLRVEDLPMDVDDLYGPAEYVLADLVPGLRYPHEYPTQADFVLDTLPRTRAFWRHT